VGDLASAFTPALGLWLGQVVFGIGIIGAAFVALIVVALALAWGFGDVTGKPHSLAQSPREAPAFYGAFALVVAAPRAPSPYSSCRTSWRSTSPPR
jgi:Mn2+/Fe2+ NRAMP family transporter